MNSNQEGCYYKELSRGEILKRFGNTELTPIYIQNSYDKALKTNLIVPPKYQSYSLATEYMVDRFYKKFPENFFKHKYLDDSHILDSTNTMTIHELIVVNKPAAHISVQDDTNYNRENIDLHNLGLTLYTNRCRMNDAFFKDRENNLYIALCFRQIKMNFDFTIRLNTKSTQDDVQELCEMAFKANGSEKHFIDVDYPIPAELIGQLACDIGICKDGKYDVYQMLQYFNKRSDLAIHYKFNQATGNMEYFLKVPRCLIHIKTSDIRKDPGQRRNMVTMNHAISFSSEVLFPSIKFFAYYSLHQWQSIHSVTKLDSKSFLFGLTNLCNIPVVDEHGWQELFRTTYMIESEEEKEQMRKGEKIVIDMSGLLAGELGETIEYVRTIAISPAAFINIKAFNMVSYINISLDWNNMRLIFEDPLTSYEVYLIIYVNNAYIHDTMSVLKKHEDVRIREYDDRYKGEDNLTTKLLNL